MLKRVRISLLGWIIVPFMLFWILGNYLVGLIKQPVWQGTIQANESAIRDKTTSTFRWKNEGLVTFWFDDAWLSQYTTAFPILEENGMKGSIAVPTEYIGNDDYLSWAQVKRLQFKGWEIDSHGRIHKCEVQKLSPEQINSEIVGSKQDLEAQGISADVYVTPCGEKSESMKGLIINNYLSLRSSEDGINPLPLKNPYQILVRAMKNDTTPQKVENLIQEAKTSKAWVILMFHQIDNQQAEFAVTPEKFNEFVKIVKDSKLPVVLPNQVLNLVEEKGG